MLAMWREQTKRQGHRNDFRNNVTEVELEKHRGNSKSYTLERLKKQHHITEERDEPDTLRMHVFPWLRHTLRVVRGLLVVSGPRSLF